MGLNHPEWEVVIPGDAYSSRWYKIVMPNQWNDVKSLFLIQIVTMRKI